MLAKLRTPVVALLLAAFVYAAVRHGPLVVLQYAYFLVARSCTSLRVMLHRGAAVDTSWDGQAGFVAEQLRQVPLAAGVERLVVDIGAHDGVWQSNSHLFLQLGWRAILVEPHLQSFASLRRNIGERFAGTARLVRAAVSLD